MISVSGIHVAVVARDGAVSAWGNNYQGQCKLPRRCARTVSCGGWHTVLLCNDGEVVTCGRNREGQCNIPLWPPADYTQVSAAAYHTGLLHSDGIRGTDNHRRRKALYLRRRLRCISPVVLSSCSLYTEGWLPNRHSVAVMLSASPGFVKLVGSNRYGQCELPWDDNDDCISRRWVQVSCGWYNTVVLSSHGRAYVCGGNQWGQCELPIGKPYMQVSAGGKHTVGLHPTGAVSACGDNRHGQCDIPELDPGIWYTQVSAGVRHTVLLRSDGTAVACGRLCDQCPIPVLPEGTRYTQVCASPTGDKTALLRSDGVAMTLAGSVTEMEL